MTSKADVRRAQEILNANGFPAGAVDGEAGARTRAAVTRFQTAWAGGADNAKLDRGQLLQVDGVIGPRTLAALNELTKGPYGYLSPHFTVRELDSNGNGTCYVHRELVLALETLRATLGGNPLTIVSAYRDPVHNERVRGARNSMHLHGLGADLMYPCRVEEALRLRLFSGIGDTDGRVRHVDLRHLAGRANQTPGATPESPARWSY